MPNSNTYLNVIEKSTLFLLPILSGLFLGIGFVFPYLWFFVFPGMFVALNFFKNTSTWWGIIKQWTVVWFIKTALALSWVWSVYPMAWIEFSSKAQELLVIGLYWLSGALWISFGGAVAGFILYKIYSHSKQKIFFYFLVAPVWLLGELLGPLFFSIFTLGPGSYLQTYMSFGTVGYLFGVTELGIFFSEWGGVYFLTILLVASASGLHYLYQAKKIKTLKSSVLIMLGVVLLFQQFDLIPNYEKTGQTVVGVDTDFISSDWSTSDSYTKRINITGHLVDEVVKLNPDYILLPEDTRYFESKFGEISTSTAINYFMFMHPDTKSILIDSGRVDTVAGDTFLRATIFDGRNHALYQFDKQYLTPQGEYVPYLYTKLFRLFGFGDRIAEVSTEVSYTPGPFNSFQNTPSYIPGVLFCLESVQSNRVGQLKFNTDIPFIAHPISHGWFHHSKVLKQQLKVMLRIQSRSNNIPIVSAGNLVSGQVYLPDGRVLDGEVILEGEKWQAKKYEI